MTLKENILQTWKKWWPVLWRHPGHLIWIVLAYLPFLGRISVPLTGDQKVYISTAMEMREQGSWLIPLLFGEPSYFKPPLQYWAILGSWNLFGFNLWATLLPSVFCVVATAWLLGEISLLIYGSQGARRGLIGSGLWFAAALGTMTYGTTAQMEIFVCFFYALSWWAGLKYLERPRLQRQAGWLFAAFVVAGVAGLVKSPLYSVFWVVSYLSYLIVAGEWEVFRYRRLYAAWAAGIVVGAAWYVAILFVDGSHFWSQYGLQETWGKKSGNQSSPLSLWLALLYFCLPFALLLFPSFRMMWKKRHTGDILRMIFCWSWAPALFFTFYPYRVKPYFFLLVPAMALLIEWGFFQVGKTIAFKVLWITSGCLSFIALAFLGLIFERTELVPWYLVLAFGVLACATLLCSVQSRGRGFVACALGMVLLLRTTAICLGEQDIADLRKAVEAAEAQNPNVSVAVLDERHNIWHDVGLLSVALEKPLVRLQNLEQVKQFVREGGWVIFSDEQVKDQLSTLEASFTASKQTLQQVPWRRWKGKMKFPFRQLLLHERVTAQELQQQFQREFRILSILPAVAQTTSASRNFLSRK